VPRNPGTPPGLLPTPDFATSRARARRSIRATACLCAFVVVSVVIGLESPASTNFDETHQETMYLGISKDILIIKPAEEPKMCLAEYNRHRVFDCAEEWIAIKNLSFRTFTSRNHIFDKQMFGDHISDMIGRSFVYDQSMAYLSNYSWRFPIIFESILNLWITKKCHRFRIWICGGCLHSSVKIVTYDHDIEPSSFGSDSSISGFLCRAISFSSPTFSTRGKK